MFLMYDEKMHAVSKANISVRRDVGQIEQSVKQSAHRSRQHLRNTTKLSGPKKSPSAADKMIRLFVECIVLNSLMLSLFLLLLPLAAVFNLLKVLERFVLKSAGRGSIAMDSQDAIFQLQTSNEKPLIMTVVFDFETGSAEDDLQDTVEDLRKVTLERVVDAKNENGELLYPRLRWLVRPGYFQYFFEEDTNFSIDKHVFMWDGEIPCSKEALEDIISKLSADPLPQGRSPWSSCCIPTNFDDKSILCVFRMHHSLADGVSLSRCLLHKLPDNVTSEKEARKFSSHNRALLSVKAAFVTARCLVKMLFTWADRSVLHGPEFSGVEKVAWSEPFDLNRIKEIKNATGTTVNDVLMACLSGALRKYQQKKGVHSPDDVTAISPVDVRPPGETALAFENKLGSIMIKLPVALEGAADQLMATKSRIDEIKTSGEAFGTAWFIHATGSLFPMFLIKPLINFASRKASVLVSNVRGPQNVLFVGGHRLKSAFFWPPQRDNFGIGLFSYGGKIQLGVQGDVAVLPQPQLIIQEFRQALDELANCTSMLAQSRGS